MNPLPQPLSDGLSLGAIYALIAVGYSLVWGVLRTIHLAQPAIILTGAWTASVLAAAGPAHSIVGGLLVLAAASLAAAGAGLVVERLVDRPLREAPPLHGLLAGLAVSLLVAGVARTAFGASASDHVSSVVSWSVSHQGVLHEVVIGATIVLLLLYLALAYRTRNGTALRAYSLNRNVARLAGISDDIVIPFAFLLASGLAGAAGALHVVRGTPLDPWVGFTCGLSALAAALAGGMGHLRRIVLVALLLGMAETLIGITRLAAWQPSLPLIVIITALALRPRSRFGRPISEAR